MKNTPTASEGSERGAAAWQGSLAALEADLRRQGATERTRRAHGAEAARFAAWAIEQGVEPAAVTPQTVRRYAALLSERPQSRHAAARSLAALRVFFRVQVQLGELEADPTARRPTPAATPLARVPTPADVAALLERVPAHGSLELRDRALFEAAFRARLHLDELIGLDVESVSCDGRRLRVAGSRVRARVVELDEHAACALRVYVARARPTLVCAPGVDEPPEPALFVTKSGRRLSPSDVRRRLRAWTRRVALHEGIPLAWVRHGVVSALLDGGMDLRAVGELLGRTPIATTSLGTRVESAQLRATYAHSHPRA